MKEKLLIATHKTSQLLSLARGKLAKKRLFVLLGDRGAYIAAYHNYQNIKSLYIGDAEYNAASHGKVLAEFKSYSVYCFVDSSDVAIKHIEVPAVHGISWCNNIATVLKKSYSADTLVDHRIFGTRKDVATEVSAVCVASTQPKGGAQSWINAISAACCKPIKLYFFGLHTPPLMQYLLQQFKIPQASDLRIFVTMTSVSGIRILAAHHLNIVYNKVIECTSDKSRDYVQNVIEQEVGLCITALRGGATELPIKPCLIFLMPHEMQVVLQTSVFEGLDVCILPIQHTQVTQGLMDNVLLECLSKENVNDGANNHALQNFTHLKRIKFFILKPLQTLLICSVCLLIANEVEILSGHYEASDISKEYAALSKESEQFKEKYPNISDIDDLIAFQSANLSLNQQQILPFAVLENVLELLSSNFSVESIDWKLNASQDKVSVTERSAGENQLFEICGKYSARITNRGNVVEALKIEMASLSRSLSKFNIEYVADEKNMISHGELAYIPMKVTVKSNKE